MSTPVVLASRVEAVRLFHRGATVQRRVELELGDGGALPERIEVPGLPLALRDETVRVRLADDAAPVADVLATDVHVGLHVRPRAEVVEVPALDALRELERRIERLEADLERLHGERELLEGVEIPQRPEPKEGEAPPPTPLTARLALDGFVAEAVDERLEQMRTLRRELEDATEQRDDLRQRLARIDAAGRVAADEVTKSVTARLRGSAPAGATLALVVEYFVDGARWAPQYQCRIARDGSRATVALRALICQRTGEDWQGVRLELSTADAVGWTELPRLTSLRIGRAQRAAAEPPGFRPPPHGAQALFGDFDQGRERARALAAGATQPRALASVDLTALRRELASLRESDAELRRALFVSTRQPETTGAVAGYGGAGAELEEAWAESADEGRGMAAFAASEAPARVAAPPPPPAAPRRMPAPGGAAQPKRSARHERAAKKVSSEVESMFEPVALQLPSFSALRLPAPDNASLRGRLVPVDRRQAYEASLARTGLRVDGVDVLSLVAQAEAAARQASQATLPAGASDVRAVAGVFDYAYHADARVDVPSDASFHSVPLGEREGACELEYVVVPRRDTHVYRVAHIDNPLPAPLLPGTAELYVGDEYVLTTTLPTVAPRERFRLGLGVEQAIKCARNTHFREARSGSAVVATSELWHTVSVELVNNLPRAARVEVRERLPQAGPSAEVVVEEARVEPPWEPYDQAERQRVLLGGRRWRLELGAGQARTLEAEYVIKIYAQNEIVGGNRREA